VIDYRVKIVDETKRVENAAARSAFRSLGHAAGSIRKTAIASIEVSSDPSKPGEPPHTRPGKGGRALKRSIAYDVEQSKLSAVVGARASVVGESGRAHEVGGEFKGDAFEKRPFMVPALDEQLDRFASDWAGSIGE
jgi:hypothetical protein